MRKPLAFLAVAALGLLLGVGGGRKFWGQDPLPRPSGDATASAKDRRDDASVDSSNKKQIGHARDLAFLLRWLRDFERGHPALLHELERLETAQLRDLILEVSRSGKEDAGTRDTFLATALNELYRREGEESLRWADALEDGDLRKQLLPLLICEAAADSPEMANPWIDRFREQFGKSWLSSFASSAFKGATSRSAEDLLRLKDRYGDYLGGWVSLEGPFPDGFDFKRLIAGAPQEWRLHSVVRYWGARDPEAAWKAAREMLDSERKGGFFAGSIFRGIAAADGEAKAAEWIAPRLAELSEATRRGELISFFGSGPVSVETVEALAPRLASDADRRAFATQLIVHHRDPAVAIALLRSMNSAESQVQAMTAAATGYSRGMRNGSPSHAVAVREYFNSTMTQLGFSPESVSSVFSALEPSPAE